MPGLFSRLKGKDSKSKKKNGANDHGGFLASKPTWDDAWTRKFVEPEEIEELLHFCTDELKARGTNQGSNRTALSYFATATTMKQVV